MLAAEFKKYLNPAVLLTAAVLGAAVALGGGASGTGLWDIARIVLVFAVVVVFLRCGADVGVALLAAALALGLLFAVEMRQLFDALTLGLFQWGASAPATTPELHKLLRGAALLALIIILINTLGLALGEAGAIRSLILALERLVPDVRWVAGLLPSVIGMLPMPGGAMLSAPFVQELGERMELDGNGRTVVNYWFRHVWEHWWPLFPAVLLITQSGFLAHPFALSDLIKPGLVLSATALVVGWFFLLRPAHKPRPLEEGEASWRDVVVVIVALWPVMAVVAAIIVLPSRVPKAYSDLVFPAALLAVDIVLVLANRFTLKQVWKVLRPALSPHVVALVFAVYILRGMFTVSHAAEHLPAVLAAYHIPAPLICFAVPWIVGMLTGYTLAGVATTFPVLMGLLTQPMLVVIAYNGAFIGVMMSPVHLCLILTKQYYSADFGAVYRRLAPLYATVIGALVIVAWLMW